jgi:hypothetical protein
MGLSRIAPRVGNQSSRGISRIYPAHSHQQDAPTHQPGVGRKLQELAGETTMITETKVALLFAALIGLAAVAIGGLSSSGYGTGLARSAAVNADSDSDARSAPVSSACSILYPVPCAYFELW